MKYLYHVHIPLDITHESSQHFEEINTFLRHIDEWDYCHAPKNSQDPRSDKWVVIFKFNDEKIAMEFKLRFG